MTASATHLLQDLATGRTSAAALTEAALVRIAQLDPDLHAFITMDADGARRAAQDSDLRRAKGQNGALEGIPVAIKDNIDVAVLPTTDGAAFYASRIASQDAGVVTRLREAGAVILGKLNMHEGALGATTNNPFWGRCDNPAAPGHTPGGSRGGSAAAVAAGLVPIALGTDTMGSVRIPAAYCGLWGLKPTRGLIGTSGLSNLSWTLDTIGPLARTADDLALALAVLAGPDAADPWSLPPPKVWLATVAPPALDRLALGLPEFDVICEPEVQRAFDDLCIILVAHGSTLRSVTVDGWSPAGLRRAGLLVAEAEAGHLIGADLDSGRPGFSDSFRASIAFGRSAPGSKVVAAMRQLTLMQPACCAALAGVDALLLPTAPQRAFAHTAPVPPNQADFTALANAAGLPALSFPLPVPTGSLPVGAQLVGPAFSDHRLIAIARAILQGIAP